MADGISSRTPEGSGSKQRRGRKQAPSLQLRGTIRTVLTWNLGRSAFLESDGSRHRYQLLRGGQQFAEFARRLAGRVAASPFFDLDPGDENDLELPYRAGLLSQYAIDYEFLPTYRVRETIEPSFAFDTDIAKRLERLEGRPPGFREALERAAYRQLLEAWREWPIKRARLSRYGLLQVILERRTAGYEPVTTLLHPISLLNRSMGLTTLSKAAKAYGDLERDLSELGRAKAAELHLPIAISVQWEIVGRILSWFVQAIHDSPRREDRFRFNPDYRVSWRERPAHAGGTALPLRNRFFIILIDGLKRSRSSKEVTALSDEIRLGLARLHEGIPLVGYEEQVKASPQRSTWLMKVVENDEASWEGEACFLSKRSAVIASLHPPDMVVKFDDDVPYRSYWGIVARTFEYLTELSLLARLIEQKTSDMLEKLMLETEAKRRLNNYEDRVRFSGTAASLVARLRNALTPNTISPTEALFSKAAKLTAIFGIGASLDHTDHNLSAIQRLANHAESLKNERGVLQLTVGLAAFTAVLMGLALPPFYHYGLDSKVHDHLRWFLSEPQLRLLAEVWGDVATLLTGAALVGAGFYLAQLLGLRRHARQWSRGMRNRQAQVLRSVHLRAQALSSRLRRGSVRIPRTPELDTGWCRPLVRSNDRKSPEFETKLFLAHHEDRLLVRFDCAGAPSPSRYTRRDDPLWEEDSVQVFLAAEGPIPARYVEFELNPNGAILDAVIINPARRRSSMAVDTSWNCEDLTRRVEVSAGGWHADLEIPLASILSALNMPNTKIPDVWVGNFYRIRRPTSGQAEFTALFPTKTDPVDFHRPDRFGKFTLSRQRPRAKVARRDRVRLGGGEDPTGSSLPACAGRTPAPRG